MKRRLICGFAALAFSLNAQAEPKDKDKDNGAAAYSVPDTGSTALLLGSALLVLGVASVSQLARQVSRTRKPALVRLVGLLLD